MVGDGAVLSQLFLIFLGVEIRKLRRVQSPRNSCIHPAMVLRWCTDSGATINQSISLLIYPSFCFPFCLSVFIHPLKLRSCVASRPYWSTQSLSQRHPLCWAKQLAVVGKGDAFLLGPDASATKDTEYMYIIDYFALLYGTWFWIVSCLSLLLLIRLQSAFINTCVCVLHTNRIRHIWLIDVNFSASHLSREREVRRIERVGPKQKMLFQVIPLQSYGWRAKVTWVAIWMPYEY